MQQSADSGFGCLRTGRGLSISLACLLMTELGVGAMHDVHSRTVRELPPSIHSASRRFSIAADDATDRMTLARWSDDIYRRFIERWQPAPALPDDCRFWIVVEADDGMVPGGGIRRRSSPSDPERPGVLTVRDVSQVDVEAYAEAVCALLLDAMVREAQPAGERDVFEESLPAWIPVGIAQTIYPELRTRNQHLVIDLWRADQLPDSKTILSWETLSSRRGFDKAVSGVWMAWLQQHVPDRSALLNHWIARVSEGWPLDANHLLPSGITADIELEWEAYVASLQRLFSVDSRDGAAWRYHRLREGMQVHRGVGGVPVDLPLPEDAGLDSLLAWRRDRWVRSFIRQRRSELLALATGRDSDYQVLVSRVIGFLDAIQGRRPRFLIRRDYAVLLEDLAREQRLALDREQYLSLFEQRFHRRSYAEPALEIWLDGQPRSRLRHYVNGFDTP